MGSHLFWSPSMICISYLNIYITILCWMSVPSLRTFLTSFHRCWCWTFGSSLVFFLVLMGTELIWTFFTTSVRYILIAAWLICTPDEGLALSPSEGYLQTSFHPLLGCDDKGDPLTPRWCLIDDSTWKAWFISLILLLHCLLNPLPRWVLALY